MVPRLGSVSLLSPFRGPETAAAAVNIDRSSGPLVSPESPASIAADAPYPLAHPLPVDEKSLAVARTESGKAVHALASLDTWCFVACALVCVSALLAGHFWKPGY